MSIFMKVVPAKHTLIGCYEFLAGNLVVALNFNIAMATWVLNCLFLGQKKQQRNANEHLAEFCQDALAVYCIVDGASESNGVGSFTCSVLCMS